MRMLSTPPGRSLVSKTWYMSRASSGYFWLGTTTTELDRAIAGAKRETKPRRGNSSGQAMPMTPTGS